MQSAISACGGTARIDGNDFVPRRSRAAIKPLVQHRMAPGRVAADQYHQIGFLQSS